MSPTGSTISRKTYGCDLDPKLASMLACISELVPQMVAIIEQPGYAIRYINRQGMSMLGVRAGENINGVAFTEFLPSRVVPQWLYEATVKSLEAGIWRGAGTFAKRDATECPVEWMVVGRPASEGRQESFLILARDLSASLELATSLEQEEVLIEALLDYLPDNIYFKDLGSRFLRVGRTMAKRMGFDNPDDLVGKTDFDLFTKEHAQPAFDDEQRIIQTSVPIIGLEEKETYEDGRVTWVSSSKMPLYDREGHIIGTFGISRDITEQKLAEQKLAMTEIKLSEVARIAGIAEITSGVLHNISNALNSVNTTTVLLLEKLGRSRVGNLCKAVEMLESHQGDLAAYISRDPKGQQLPAYLVQLAPALAAENESLKKEVEQLRRSVEHIKEIVGMQQAYAKVSQDEDDIIPEELMEEALRISEASLHRHGISVVRRYDPASKFRGSRHKVLQILVNLIRNAKHALDESGRSEKILTVGTGVNEKGAIHFEIRDNGMGIANEHIGQLFKFGFTTKKAGHGFGLHSSMNAAVEMGGALTAASDGVGAGAVFTLVLPMEGCQRANTEGK